MGQSSWWLEVASFRSRHESYLADRMLLVVASMLLPYQLERLGSLAFPMGLLAKALLLALESIVVLLQVASRLQASHQLLAKQ